MEPAGEEEEQDGMSVHSPGQAPPHHQRLLSPRSLHSPLPVHSFRLGSLSSYYFRYVYFLVGAIAG
uniref:Uncharacterized protein n=1 Tax=Nelumbo nucifera TaxID=4432 RepID=A0A822YRI6_NELNU|nr:TPA_asm: hypothetical protein HUJ06_004639 [Nelumbo nucifera]